jgi:hypothetical protein
MVVLRVAGMKRLASGFVVEVQWIAYKYVDGIQGELRGTETFTQDAGTFVPFEKLTENLVVSWLDGRIDLVDAEAKLDQHIEAQRANQDPYPDIPWSRFRTE